MILSPILMKYISKINSWEFSLTLTGVSDMPDRLLRYVMGNNLEQARLVGIYNDIKTSRNI